MEASNSEWFFWSNEAVEVIETTGAVEVIEAAEDPAAMDITQSVNCKQFLIFEAKEAVEVIEATDVFRTT